MNLFDYTYCGNYNRQIQNLSRIVPEKWSFGSTEDNGILKGYLEHTFQRVYEEGKILETDNYAIFNTGLFIISLSMFILSQILSRTGRGGSWRDFIRNTTFSKPGS